MRLKMKSLAIKHLLKSAAIIVILSMFFKSIISEVIKCQKKSEM